MNRMIIIFLSAVCFFTLQTIADAVEEGAMMALNAESQGSVVANAYDMDDSMEMTDDMMDMDEDDDMLPPEGGKAVADLKGTAPDSPISGTVTLTETLEGLKVDVEVAGVPAGKHGFHIHETGSCEDGGKAAGGHFNPKNVTHGFLPKDGLEHAHCGDMGNIEVSPDGIGALSIVLPGVTLAGENGVVGRSVILHEKEDDFGQPTGNAGGRIACGVITKSE